ncbi:MAG: thermonuclease family protein [Candidatus Thiodiazotropha sp. LLP2]
MNLIRIIRNSLTILLLFFSLGADSVTAANLQGRVINVFSGELIQAAIPDGRRRQIKLLGIRVPVDSRQMSTDAKQHLHMLIAGRAISVEYRVVMANGVILGTVKHGGADIALRMLKAGMARVADEAHLDPKTRRDYLAAETLAKSRRMGLWHLF